MTEISSFHNPQRQSLIGVVVYLLRNARIILSVLVAGIALGNENSAIFPYLAGGMVLIVMIVVWFSWLQYRNFTFHVENDALIIHHGVLVKDKKTIPLSRIQSVHIEQNIIQQALGVVGLKIDSAGSSEKELEIAALRQPVAREFRDLLKRKPVVGNAAETIPDEDQVVQESREEVLVRLTPFDLLKVGLTENHVRNGLVAILVVYGYITQYMEFAQEYITSQVGEYMDEVPGQLVRAGLALVVAGLLAFIVVSIIISLVRTVLKFYDFRAAIQGDVVEIRSGLLKKNEYRIPVHKIQYLKWESNPLRKLLGFTTVRIYQVEPGKQKKKTRVEIPACFPDQARALQQLVYEQEVPESSNMIRADKWAYTRFYSMVFSVPVITGSALLYLFYPVFWYLPLFLIPFIVFLAFKYGKSVQITFFEDFMLIEKGWIFPRRTVLSYFKCQAVRFADNLLIRKRGLAHLVMHTASGSVRIRYMDQRTVLDACNYAIYKVESSVKSWM